MKKNNGRRKQGRQRAQRKAAAHIVPARSPMTPVTTIAHAAPSGRALSKAVHRIDWPALAIVVVPLAIMALLPPPPSVPIRPVAEIAPWQGDLALEAMPIQPDTTSRVAFVPPLPVQGPWRGDVMREAMPLQPDPTSRVALVPPLPVQGPWRGDLMREAMPLQQDPASRMADATPIAPIPEPPLPAPAVAAAPPPPAFCIPEAPRTAARSVPELSFGHALSHAALAQTNDFVIYNARYISIAYPGGDTNALYGVCTDIVIRAYRALDIDLQKLIHLSRLGRGDPSIDHRRVEVVRRFLARFGTSLDISEFAEDYRPGDIVTYHRPEGRISQSHIAIVTDQTAPSGRPLIAHNRGWGPKVEDALFVDRITGHYRLSPSQVEAFMRSRAPLASEQRRRTADIVTSARRR